jgi:hypothetical protein
MTRKLLTIPLLFAAFLAVGQTKHKYYYADAKFAVSDGCVHDMFDAFDATGSLTLDELYQVFKDHCKPYKIDKKSFHLTEYRQITRKEYLTYHGAKFEACKPIDLGVFKNAKILATCDTCHFSISAASDYRTEYRTVFMDGTANEILTISAPDSTNTYTVKFRPSLVKFINDSTFTIKIKQ